MTSFPKPSTESPDVRALDFSVFDYAYNFVLHGNLKTTIILLYAVFALTAWKYVEPAPRFADPETGACVLGESFADATTSFSEQIKPLDQTLSSHISVVQFLWNARKFWTAFLLMGVFPALIVKFVFKEKLSDYGLTLGILKRSLFNFCLFLPFMILLGWMSGDEKGFYNVYPFNPLAGVSTSTMIVHSIMYLAFYYTAWEFMFRGFIQLGLTDKLGAVPAVLIQVVASTMLHYGHPATETFGCIAGGLLWGFLVYRTKSLFSGWGQHAALGIALDWSLVLKAC